MRPFLVGIAGGSGSGKTTLANEISSNYDQKKVAIIEQDSYYINIPVINMKQKKKFNFDHPSAIDITLFEKDLKSLLEGKTINVPLYDFKTHSRLKEYRQLKPHHIIVVEGILVLHYPQIRELFSLKIFVDTPEDLRFNRRQKRDINERGRNEENIIEQYVNSVRPMHDKFVEPSKYFADEIILGENRPDEIIGSIIKKIKSKIKE
tara:strand:+ start:1745 stop:2362 length:618 start_codon:yes stop_codon:yes gene_type:complete